MKLGSYSRESIHWQLSTRIVIGWLRGQRRFHLTLYTPKSRTIADIPSRPPVLGDFDNPGQLPIDFLNFFPIYGLEVKEFNAGMQSH